DTHGTVLLADGWADGLVRRVSGVRRYPRRALPARPRPGVRSVVVPLVAGPPHHHGVGARDVDQLIAGPPGGARPPAQFRDLLGQLRHPAAERVGLRGEIDDPLDAGEVDALVLTEPLHLTQQGHVLERVPTTAAPGAFRGDDAQAVVRAEGLRVKARPVGRDRAGQNGVLGTAAAGPPPGG